MAKTMAKQRTVDQLQSAVDEIAARPATAFAPSAPPRAVASDSEPRVYADAPTTDRKPFGGWLISQHQHKREWIANLAKMAKLDPAFPKAGTPEDVRKHLSARGAEGEAFEAVDDAELEWDRL